MLRSIPFHPKMNLSLSFGIFTHPDGRVLDTVCNILETFDAYKYRIYKLDFCSYNFNQLVKTSHIHNYRTRSVSSDSFYIKFSRTDKMHAFFSPSGKGEIDVYRFMFKQFRSVCAFFVTIPCHTSTSFRHHTRSCR